MQRRTIQKITPQRPSTFDQQFWPVIVALTVLCGIAMGVVLTLLNGPWMWGSLLILPTASALAVFFLFHLDDTRLRRSLQLAIILSLAVHMAVLIIAALTNVFANPFAQPEREVAQKEKRTIEISDRRTEFIFEQTDPKETPEPEIETEKKKETTTKVKPKPLPVENRKVEVQPQLTRRETPQQTVPKLGQQLSQLRRQRNQLQPNSSVKATREKPVTSQAEPQPKESSAAATVSRRSPEPSKSQPMPRKAQTNPAPTPSPSPTASVAKSQRLETSPQPRESSPKSSTSSARLTRSTPQIPRIQKQSPLNDRRSANLTRPSEPRPSPKSTEITKRMATSRTVRPAVNMQPEKTLSPKSEVARSTQRRNNPTRNPTVSQTPSNSPQRRSTTDASVAVSPVPVEQPNRRTNSSQQSSQLNARTMSITRSTSGSAGVGVSRNLDRATGGMTSPAIRASDSAKRRRTENRPTENRLLTSSQAANARRATGPSLVPSSAFKANTTANAKIAGSSNPTERSMESSAARINSASADHRSAVSAERGDTNVDLGPTKVVAGRESTRRSGGGQPEIGEFNPDSTQRSTSNSRNPPSLVAKTGVSAVAPRSMESSASSNAIEVAERTTTMTRAGGSEPVAAVRDSAATRGEFSNQGDSAMAEQLADSRMRAQRSERESSESDDEDEEDEDQRRRGNQRTRIAKAPVTRADTGFGNAESVVGPNVNQSSQRSDAPSESIADILQRRASAALPGSGLARSATSALMQAATNLPVVDASSSSQRSNNRPATSFETEPSRDSGQSRGRGSAEFSPQISKAATGVAKTKTWSDSASGETGELDSASVSVERLNPSNQQQGAAMEVVAIEGPAGLADKPDLSLGIMNRPATRDSQQILPTTDSRFRNNRFGGTPALNPDAVLAKDAFRKRNPAAMSQKSEPTTEAAIMLGLEFLARNQLPDGSWTLNGFDHQHPQHVNQLNSDAAATGLAILAFQGAGYNHREFKYAQQINQGLQWLVQNQRADGCLYVESDKKSDDACRLYSHGIAALALTEAFGMTQDPQLKSAAQNALDYISESQDRRKGGWRYFDTPNLRSSDTSVTGWMLMAMQSGELAGLKVNARTFERVDQWLGVAAEPEDDSVYRYNPFAVDSEGISRIQGRQASVSMTAVGLLMRIYRGWDREDPRLIQGAQYMIDQQMPSDSDGRVRDTYYWYYATQVMKHIDGPLWEQWNGRLRPLLIESQTKSGEMSGSWHPYNPVPDRWATFGGRLYVTTMNLLSLEVRYRLLPLYKETNTITE